MTRDKFNDNNKGKILEVGTFRNHSTITIENASYVKGLTHNLFNISQLCNKYYKIIFDSLCCMIESNDDKQTRFKGNIVDNIYMIDTDDISSSGTHCLLTKSENSWL